VQRTHHKPRGLGYATAMVAGSVAFTRVEYGAGAKYRTRAQVWV